MSEVKRWRSTSPSQLSSFSSCARKWWRVSVNGERPPSSPAAERGSKIHEELENYLMHGAEVSDGTARAMLASLPPAGSVPPAQVEIGFEWRPDGWPVPIRGRVDLVEAVGGVELAITDHKTTASLQYAKSERDLKRDPQALLYSAAALAGALEGVSSGRAERVRFRLLYGTTRAPYVVRSVGRVFEADELAEGVDYLKERAVAQAELAHAAGSWVDAEPNYSACDKFGGCPFFRDCRAAVAVPIVEVKKLSGSNMSDWLGALKARREELNGGGAVEPAPVAVQEPAPVAVQEPAPVAVQEPAPVAVQEPAPVAVQEPAPFVEPSAEELEAMGPAPFEVEGEQYEMINPPDGLPDGAPLPAEDEAPKRSKIRIDGKPLSSLKASEAQDAVSLYEAGLSAELLAVYRARAEGLGSTLKDNRERLKLLDAVMSGAVVSAPVGSTLNLFDSPPAPVAVQEPSPAPVAVQEPSPAPVAVQEFSPAPPAPVAVQEFSPAPPAPVAVQEPAPVVTPAPAPPVGRDPRAIMAPSVARVLLIDCHAAGAVDGDAALAPLIAEIGRSHGVPVPLMDYARGWVLVAFEVERRGWAEVFAGASVVRFDSASPLYKHGAYTLLAQASFVVRGTR